MSYPAERSDGGFELLHFFAQNEVLAGADSLYRSQNFHADLLILA
jgi:hypothetical protein